MRCATNLKNALVDAFSQCLADADWSRFDLPVRVVSASRFAFLGNRERCDDGVGFRTDVAPATIVRVG